MRERPETTGEGLVPSPTASTTGEELDLELEMEEESPATSSMNDYQYPPDVKLGIEELCPVCGDKVSGYHYGLLTCESCKGFFKRTVQNKKVYSCVDNRTCHIDKSQRKRCPYCRFQKCLSVGMKLEAVRPDRMRGGRNKFGPMYKRDRAIKQQAVRQRQQLLAQYQIQLSNAGMTSLPNVDIHGEIKPNMGMYGSVPPPQGGVGPPGGMISGSPMRPMMPLPPRDNHQCMTSSPVSMPLESSQAAYVPPPCTQPYTVPSMMGDLSPHHPQPPQHLHHPHHEQHLHHHSHLPPHSVTAHRTLPAPPIVPPLIKHLQANEPSEEEVQHKLASFVESEVVSICHQRALMGQQEFGREFLHLVCKLCDQCLFLLVEWARGAHFFKDLKVEDQMKLLQNCWSELLILNFVYRQAGHHKYDEIVLGSGQVVTMDVLNEIGLGDCRDRLVYLVKKFQDLKVDHHEYTCMKFAILLNPDVAGVQERQRVEMSQEKVNSALIEYCSAFYADINDRFGQLLLRLPEIRAVSVRAEEYLYYRHLSGDIPEQTLLMEMLHSKRR